MLHVPENWLRVVFRVWIRGGLKGGLFRVLWGWVLGGLRNCLRLVWGGFRDEPRGVWG